MSTAADPHPPNPPDETPKPACLKRYRNREVVWRRVPFPLAIYKQLEALSELSGLAPAEVAAVLLGRNPKQKLLDIVQALHQCHEERQKNLAATRPPVAP